MQFTEEGLKMSNRTPTSYIALASMLIVILLGQSIGAASEATYVVSGQTGKHVPFFQKLSPEAAKLQRYVSEQVALHPGWVGDVESNQNSAHIRYLGPLDKNPDLVTDPKILAAVPHPLPPQASPVNNVTIILSEPVWLTIANLIGHLI